MDNHTQYRLKSDEELGRIFAQRDDLFIISCNKCFQEYGTPSGRACDTLVQLAQDWGRNITGTAQLDFLCSQTRTGKVLEDLIPRGTGHILVASCGLGVQTVAELTGKSVFAACDGVGGTAHPGVALTDKACGACAQCYLNSTGGICPVVDCAKGLLNGQCGGAQNGKCEVSPHKDCAWEKIHRRLEMQDRLDELKDRSVRLRDYSRVDRGRIADYVRAVRESRFAGYGGGIHPAEGKESTRHLAPVPFPEQEVLTLNLAQHSGTPAIPVVAVGDRVKAGQKVGRASDGISANIHSPVSGRVIAIGERTHATRGGRSLAVVIENDRKNTLHESVRPLGPLEELTAEQILEAVQEAGIVGLGGAGFPLHIKLRPGKPIDTVLLNGCECEPMVTSDHQLMLLHPEKVIFGLKAMMKVLGAAEGVIAIEDNKPDALARMEEKTAGEAHIRVCSVKAKYPQGGERMLVRTVLGRHVPGGMLPADMGCVVSNVATAKAVFDAVVLGMPLTERIVTVSGDRVKRPGNYTVKIGTEIRKLLEYCGGITGDGPFTAMIGGPMMGTALEDLSAATTKCTNAIAICDRDPREPGRCIRCGRCVDVCPMGLEPLKFAENVTDEAVLRDLKITDCMECRCCEYICAARIPLTDLIRAGKTAVREN